MDVNFNGKFDDSDITEGLERMAQKVERGQEAFDKMGEVQSQAFGEAGDAINEYEKELDKTIGTTAKFEEETKKTQKTTNAFYGKMKNYIRDINVFGVSLGSIVDVLGKKQKALLGTTKGLGLASKALRIFKVALISTGIGAIVVALGSLVALLTRTQKGVDFVSRVMAGLGAAVSVVIDHFATLGSAIVKLFQGDFRGAAETAKSAFTGLGENIRESTAAAYELEGASQKLRDRERELNVERAKAEAQIERLRNQSRETNRTYAERQELLRQAIALENELEEKSVQNAEERLRIIKEQNSLSSSLSADLDKEAEAEAELYRVQAEASRKQREDQEQLRSIKRQAADEARRQQDEELKRIQAINNAIESQLELLAQRVQDARLSQLSEAQRLAAEYEIARQEVENLRQSLLDLYKEAGTPVPEDFDANFKTVLDSLDAEFRKKRDEYRDKNPIVETIRSGLDREEIPVPLNLKPQIDENSNFIEDLKVALANIIGASKEELNAILGVAGDLGGTISDAFYSNIDNQIEENDRLIEGIKERVSELEKAIDREQKAKDKAYANNLASYKKQLADANKAQEKAENERLKLEKKAANAQLLQNTAKTASNYILAVSQLLANEASKGVIGIFTATAGAALILSTIAQARANASKFSPPKFRFGGGVEDYFNGFVNGPSHAMGGKLIEVEGKEFVMRKEAVQGNRPFLDNFNSGKYSSLPLFQVAEMRRTGTPLSLHSAITQMNKNEREIDKHRRETEIKLMREAYMEAAMASSDHMIAYWKSRPVKKKTATGYVLEWQEGNSIHRQEVKEK